MLIPTLRASVEELRAEVAKEPVAQGHHPSFSKLAEEMEALRKSVSCEVELIAVKAASLAVGAAHCDRNEIHVLLERLKTREQALALAGGGAAAPPQVEAVREVSVPLKAG